MCIFKYLHRLGRLHQLIKMKATGSPSQLGEKLELSERHTRDYISQMKELGAPIAYDKRRNTYYYTQETQFDFGFKPLKPVELQEINAGFYFQNLTLLRKYDAYSC